MRFFWRIRYLDSRDRQFKDRDLLLDTEELDPCTAASVELCNEITESASNRGMLKFRHLFKETDTAAIDWTCDEASLHSFRSFCLIDYFEDENGNELTNKDMAVILSGSQSAEMFPARVKQHTIDYVLSGNRPIHLSEIKLTAEQLTAIGYFTRDVREMHSSTFCKEGAGTLSRQGDKVLRVQTAASDEEIRSFVMVFRRLYMKNEPANFDKSATIFCEAASGYSLANWIKGEQVAIKAFLEDSPTFIPYVDHKSVSFSQKRLIDIFLYTQYAHQPNRTRERQFRDCLRQVNHNKSVLFWLFLGAIWECSLHYWNAGKIIAGFFDQYSQYHEISSEVLNSLSYDHPGIGSKEKKQDRVERLLNEQACKLADALWSKKGCPEGGPEQYVAEARTQLKATIQDL